MKFIDLFAGLGGFHLALSQLGHECVFASEIDDELRDLYTHNFPSARDVTYGDIRLCKHKVPPHDILCAGFPCQPFSKSGSQQGVNDKTLGTLFHEIVYVLKTRRPEYVVLENVGNFERHDHGRTWQVVRQSLEALGYDVRGTEHIASGGPGLLSPQHFGYPHSRERFFIVARQGSLPARPFPRVDRNRRTNLVAVVQPREELTRDDVQETALTARQIECIKLWNTFLSWFPESIPLPSFPIWGDEIDAAYPFEEFTPYKAPDAVLREALAAQLQGKNASREEMLALLPSYARTAQAQFPAWKKAFIRQNRRWFSENRHRFAAGWVDRLRSFPPSLRKLEWNCQGEERNLWKHVLQFRPSGLRAKRYTSIPALVAMTATQIPILGPEGRFLTRVEGLRLQGFPDGFQLPQSRDRTFRALGNAVHVGVVEAIARQLLWAPPQASQSRLPWDAGHGTCRSDAAASRVTPGGGGIQR